MSDSKKRKKHIPYIPLDVFCSILEFCTLEEYMQLILVVRGLLKHILKIRPSCLNKVVFKLRDLPKELPNLYTRNLRIKSLQKVKHFKDKYFASSVENSNTLEQNTDRTFGTIAVLSELCQMFPNLVHLGANVKFPAIGEGSFEKEFVFENLHSIHLGKNRKFENARNGRFVCSKRNFPRLKRLSLGGYDLKISEALLLGLEELTLVSNSDEGEIHEIVEFPESLDCTENKWKVYPVFGNSEFCDLPRLRELDILRAWEDGQNNLNVCNMILSNLPSLEVIKLSHCRCILDIHTDLPNLRVIDIGAESEQYMCVDSDYSIIEFTKKTEDLFKMSSFKNLETLLIGLGDDSTLKRPTIQLHDLPNLKEVRVNGVSISSFSDVPKLQVIGFLDHSGTLGPFIGNANRLKELKYGMNEYGDFLSFLENSDVFIEEVNLAYYGDSPCTYEMSGDEAKLIGQKVGKFTLLGHCVDFGDYGEFSIWE